MTWCYATLQLPKGQLSFVKRWPLMNPNELVFVLGLYLLFVLKIGPKIMEHRSPLEVKRFLVFYNMFKVINSTILLYKILAYISVNGLFPRRCEHDNATIYYIADTYWKFLITKVLDLFDTVFFVVRKKHTQITFLHMYHHVFMVLVTWFCLKYDPSDQWAFMAAANSTVHTVMYIYYALSAMGPDYAKYIWWKKYLTVMQLTQFVLIFLHTVIQTYLSECPIRDITYWIGLSNLFLFFCLFIDFYIRCYIVKTNKDSFRMACTKQIE